MNDKNTLTLKSTLMADLSRICDKPDLLHFFKYLMFPNGSTFPYIVWFRILQKCKRNKFAKYTVGIVVHAIYSHLSYKYGIHANANIEIGPGFRIVHRDCIYINCKSVGSNFTIYQNCTLGSSSLQNNSDIPTIGDNVVIYTGAVVVGNIAVGNNCIIGANSFVNRDVKDNSFVAGIPAVVKNSGGKI